MASRQHGIPAATRFENIWFIEGEGPASGFWPFWLSLGMLICCFWIGWNWHRRSSPPSRSSEAFLDAYAIRMLATVGGGLIVFLAMVHVAGFYGAIFLFLLYYLKFVGQRAIGETLAVAVATPVFSFFFFDVAMRIVLPKGYLEPLFIPLYAIFL